VQSPVRTHDRSRYKGKNLVFLIAALCIPAGLLYFRLVLGLAATSNRVNAVEAARLNAVANVVLGIFFIAQAFSARYQQQLLRPRRTRAGKLVQYLAMFLMSLVFSITGAILLEAFGFAVFIRVNP
jgi:hypothetical protein